MTEPHLPERAGGDADLLERCADGHVSDFEQLYRTHGARMKSIALNLLGNSSDAEDAVQDAFLKIYRGLQSFRGQATLSTWIYRIVVNSCYDLGRRRRPGVVSLDDEASDTARHTVSCSNDHPLRMALERAVARLNARDRAVFVLFEVEGFRHAEIAEILGIPEGTSVSLSAGQAVQIVHRLGNVDIRTHAQREARIDATIRVSASTQQEASEFAGRINIDVATQANMLRIETQYPEQGRTGGRRNISYSVSYQIVIPETTPLRVRNSFGQRRGFRQDWRRRMRIEADQREWRDRNQEEGSLNRLIISPLVDQEQEPTTSTSTSTNTSTNTSTSSPRTRSWNGRSHLYSCR